jgi:hypothetical protein
VAHMKDLNFEFRLRWIRDTQNLPKTFSCRPVSNFAH